MKAVEVLRGEHVMVRKLLDCLAALSVEARVLGSLDQDAAGSLLLLFERFVDWSHQDKEELWLFPHMLARATNEEAYLLERIISDHDAERRRLVALFLHLDGTTRGKTESLDRFVLNAVAYQRLQRSHVDAEEEVVLPLAEAILTPEDDRAIMRGFDKIDARLGRADRVEERFMAICDRFGIDSPGLLHPFEPPVLAGAAL